MFIEATDTPRLPIVATVACELYVFAELGPAEFEAKGNASLIAAAPDLKKALRGLLEWECSDASSKAASDSTREEAAHYFKLIEAATKALLKADGHSKEDS